MTTRPDPNTSEPPQEATEGRLSAPEGPSRHAETLEGPNGPQRGADGFQGEQQPRGPVDWARHYAAEREHGVVEERREVETLKATLARVRELAAELFVAGAIDTERAVGRRILSALAEPEPALAATEATDGCTPACHGVTGIRGLLEHVGIDTTGRDITVAGRTVDAAPAPYAGPSIREAADNDRRWPLEKHGE